MPIGETGADRTECDEIGNRQSEIGNASEWQLAEAARRQRLVHELAELMRAGNSQNQAACILGEPAANLSRYRRQFAAGGFAALLPGVSTGRKPLAVLTPEQQADVQKLTIQTDPNTGTRVSVSLALRMYAQSDKCPDALAHAILKPRASKHIITGVLKRQAKVTVESKTLARGNRAFELGCSISQPRALCYVDAAGRERRLEAGDLFERDDMTLNQPWYVEWEPDGTKPDPGAEKFGVKTLRGQLLVQICVASQRALSFELIARERDSYRSDDIWAWMGRGYRDIGLPRIGERMERGIWEGKAIHGIPVEAGQWSHDVRIGGLGALGVRHLPSFSPKTKSIESFFNSLQKVLGVTGVQVGRHQGEYEVAKKDWMACRAGRKHPADCGFLHADELVKRVANAMVFLNQDPREGEVYKGIPDELWAESTAARPLASLAPEQAWIFAPVKREATIGNGGPGMIRCRFADHECSYFFCAPELFATLGKGYRVVIAFDPAMPDLGACIFNAEAGARAHTGAAPGALLGHAELVERVPQFSMMDGFDDERGYDRRRRHSAQCRKLYRAIGIAGQRGAAANTARNTRGDEAVVERAGSDFQHRAGRAGRPAEPGLAGQAPAVGGRRARPANDFDEDAAIERANRLEREAVERGDLVIT